MGSLVYVSGGFRYCRNLSFAFSISIRSYFISGVFCVTYTVCTDASKFTFSRYLATCNDEPVRGMFSPADVYTSSSYRELKAVFYVLKSYAERLRYQKVKPSLIKWAPPVFLWLAVLSLICQGVAVGTFSICLSFHMCLESQWSSRGERPCLFG